MVYDNARVTGDAIVFNDARISNDARIFHGARVGGNAEAYDHAIIAGYARIHDHAKVYGDTLATFVTLCGNARVSSSEDYLHIGPIGPWQDYISFFKAETCIEFAYGSFQGSLAEFSAKVESHFAKCREAIAFANTVFNTREEQEKQEKPEKPEG
jgi:carbonic anhydrase/acetyltransferase-like protein (isoleucine patch superfamily)